ncbi:MAG: transposase [Bacteroidales bacterium]|nr:transposase [Bacteroidales bacterium]
MREAVYGIMASQSVMLTEIGRQLESTVPLKKIEERFSRQLIKSRIWDRLHQRILSLASSRVKDRTLLILDLSDLKKKYAEKMEYLAQVRDGSEGGEIVDGDWTNQVIASEVGSNEIIPLYMSLYSQNSPDFTSENDEILTAIDQVGEAVHNRGIWVIDRGADRDAIFEPLLQKQRDFVIRMVGTRDLIHRGETVRSLWLAYACKLPYRKTIVKIIHGKEVTFNLSFGHVKVQLPEMDTSLNMVVVRGLGSKPMMLLTTLEIGPGQKDVWFIVLAYLKRWSVEETIRFIKQTYDLENIRVLRYARLQNMMALILAVFYFVAVILDQNQKLTIMAGHILKSAKRVFGIPDFKYYALGDGLSNIFARFPGQLQKQSEISQTQLSFGFG